jgi:phosphatidylserine/phosphatidylglycerophosphate/cardiolipin synthase-like enzyme
MLHHKITFPLSLVLLSMACTIAPIGAAGGKPTAAVENASPELTATLAAPSLDPESLTSIDLHVGRGAHGSWFDLYFTDPADPAGRQFTGGVDERVVQAIDAAHLSIHAAIYNLTLNNVRAALIRAHRRGVDVRLVTESDNLDGDDFQRLVEAGVPVLGDRREGTMHDKFMVIDGAQVWTGSMNYTGSGVYADNNCLIRISSGRLAQAYEAEFSEMFVDDHFGPQIGNSTSVPTIDVNGTPVEVRFSPDDRPEAELVNLLDTAQKSIEFLAFSFTSNPLGDAVMRAQHAGVQVRGVMDEGQSSSNIGSELTAFRSAGLDVRLDGNPGQMHEKVFLIDREIVVFGSYNFSRSANESNDENLLIIHSDVLAGLFAEEFARIYAQTGP